MWGERNTLISFRGEKKIIPKYLVDQERKELFFRTVRKGSVQLMVFNKEMSTTYSRTLIQIW